VAASALDFERPFGILAILAAVLAVFPRHAITGRMSAFFVFSHDHPPPSVCAGHRFPGGEIRHVTSA
jgi:hypothetical protein